MITSKHTAIAKCKHCKQIVISSFGGHFAYCPCGKSFIDQERFGGYYVRLGGDIELIEHICPRTCEYEEHCKNKKFNDTKKLDSYMKKVYKVKWSKEHSMFI